MTYLSVLAFILISVAAGIIAGRVMRAKFIAVAAVVIGAVAVTGATLVSSFRQIPAGSVGVVYQFGEIVGQVGEGPNFIAPWQQMRTESVKVQRARFEKMPNFSRETQDVFVTATLNYSVSPDAVQSLYREVGPSWFDVLIEPRVNNFFKSEVVKYSTVEVAPNRESIRTAARDRLAEDLARYSIRVDDLLIDDIAFSEEFKQSIEQKQIATQNALREEERVRQVEFEAQQQVAAADGDARSTIRRAEGQAEANRLLAESLDATVLQYLAIERFGDKVQIVLLPSGQGLLIDPATLVGTLADAE
jgi:prohibitin 2